MLNKIPIWKQNETTKGYGLRFPTWTGVIRDDKDEISMH